VGRSPFAILGPLRTHVAWLPTRWLALAPVL
jgi:hypothetical protein